MTQRVWKTAAAEFFDGTIKKRLPISGCRNILITSALPYVNNVPHLGNIIGSVLSADVFSRYCKMQGYQSLFVCGTDEYGTATEMKALKDGVSVQEICDKFHRLHKGIYDWFEIDFDYFGRTTTEHQTEICQDIFLKIHKNKYTSISSLNQLHCGTCDKFLADRFVFGVCPHCAFDDARGDQCDGCGKLLDGVDLIHPKCHICQSTPTVKESQHIFLDLDRLSGEVEKHVNNVINVDSSHWSANAIAIVRSWFKTGLEKRCITRDLKWGTPVPLDDFKSKVFYVWFDAPIGYLSITKTLLGDDWKLWWMNPKDVDLYQFLGKDNVAFHGVLFPATQIATGDNYTKVRHICATEYLNYESQKFSKSRGIGVFGDSVMTLGIPADVWRFYLIYMRPERQDTSFNWDDFVAKVNTVLLANLGNFVNRSLTFLFTQFSGRMPELVFTSTEEEFVASVNLALTEYIHYMENVMLHSALLKVLAISQLGNQYMQANAPWVLIKGTDEEKIRAGTVIGVNANVCVLLSTMLYPFMPVTSKQIREQCNLVNEIRLPSSFIQFMIPGHKTAVSKPVPLFGKLEQSQIDEWKLRFGSEESSKSAPSASSKPKKMQAQRNPEVKSAQKEIDSLLGSIAQKFEKAKTLYVTKELDKLNVETDLLKEEVKSLQLRMGADDAFMKMTETKKAAVNDGNDSEPIVKESLGVADILPSQPKAVVKKVVKIDPKCNKPLDDEVDVGRLDLRVGRIIEAKRHPDADSLYVETIDLGEEKPRTVVSGLVRFVSLEQMQNRLVVCLCNLKPAKMRGVESQAMVMCASTPEKVEIMEVDPSCKPGDLVNCGKFVRRPDPVLNPKKKVWETVAVDLKVSDNGLAIYKGEVLTVGGKEHPLSAPSLTNVPVK